jgi:hypothetical protein
MIANEDRPFEGMDMELVKRLRAVARVNDLKNRSIPAFAEDAFKCVLCGDRLTVEDGSRCRQCVLQERLNDDGA